MSGRPPALPGYEVVGELGRGGMGVVWAGVERRSGRPVAIKVMADGWAHDPEVRLRFHREVHALRGLLHPNVVQLLDAQTDGPTPCLVLERLDGGSLADLLRRGPVAPERAAALVAGAARGVHAAHELGLVHRDLKPGNVLLAADGTPKVADFGLVRRVDSRSLTATGVAVGTPEAMAPEQLLGGDVDARADVWALGVLLYQLLVGRGPWGASRTAGPALFEAILHAEVAPPSRAAPVDPALDAVVLRCLERDPRLRPPSALALAEALEAWLEGRSAPRRGRRGRRRRLAPALAAGALLGGGVVALAVTRAPRSAPAAPPGTAPVQTARPPAAPAPAPPAPAPPAPAAPAPRAEEVSPELADLRRVARRLAEAGDPEGVLLALGSASREPTSDRRLGESLALAFVLRAEKLALAGLPAEVEANQAIELVEGAPASAEGLALLGRARLLTGPPEEAARRFQEALRLDAALARQPDVLRAATRAGVTAFEVEVLADQSFFRVAQTLPEAQGYVREGCEYFGRLTPAVEARSPAEDEPFLESLVALARLAAALGDTPRAAGALDRAVAEAPRAPLGWLARAEWRLARGEVEAAASDLSAARPLVAPREGGRDGATLGVLLGMTLGASAALRGDLAGARERVGQLLGSELLARARPGLAAAARQLDARLRRLPDGARVAGRGLFGADPQRPGGRPSPFVERPPPPGSLAPAPPLPPLAALPPGHPLAAARELVKGRSPEALGALERALAGEPDPLADEAGLNVACYACMAGCQDLMARSLFTPRTPAPPELERRRAVVERVAAAASPRTALGIVLLGLLARARQAAGDHDGARAALLAFAVDGGGDPQLAATQLFELELAGGALDEAGRAVERLRRLPDVPPAIPEALAGVLAAVRSGDARALSEAMRPLREVLRAYPGLCDPVLVPWLDARRRGEPFLLPGASPPPPPLAELSPDHPLAGVRRLLVARRALDARALLERALAAGSAPLDDPAAVEVASTTILATSADLAGRSFFERRPAPDGLATRRALIEQVAAAADPKGGTGPALLGLLARVRAAAGDLPGAREALERIGAPGLHGELTRLQLLEVGLAAGDLDAAARAAEALRRGPEALLPAAAPDVLLGLVEALRQGALDRALDRAREADAAWPGLLDPLVVPWLEGRRPAPGPR